MKLGGINKKQHVYADYSYVPLVLIAPAIGGFENNQQAAIICRSFALSALGYSLCTKAPWGVLKLIPYKIHAGLDLASGHHGLVVGTLSLIGASKIKNNL